MSEHLALPLCLKTIRAELDAFAPNNEVIGHAVCDRNGEYLTDSLPEQTCKDMVEICNTHYFNSLKSKRLPDHGKILFHAIVELPPMDKPVSRVIVKNGNGNLVVMDTPVYAKYIRDFCDALLASQPYAASNYITQKCQVTGVFYINKTDNKSVSAYVEALLDCLVFSGILKGKGHYVVNNVDGSRVFADEKEPRTEIIVRAW